MYAGEMTRVELAEWIGRMRTAKGISQEKLGDILGVRQSAVSAWEAGRNEPDLARLDQIAGVCGYRLRVEFVALADREETVSVPADLVQVVEEARQLAPDDRRRLVRLASLLSRLPQPIRDHLDDELASWSARYKKPALRLMTPREP